MNRMFVSLVALLSAVRYEVTRLLTMRSTRTTALLSLIGSALVTLPAARQAVGLAHSQAAEVAWLSGAKLTLNRGGMIASFGSGRFMVVHGGTVIGRTVSAVGNWLPHASGLPGMTAVGHGGAGVLAHAGGGAFEHSAPTIAVVGAHTGGAGVVAGGVIGTVLPAAMAALGAAWIGATSIAYEYRYGGALLAYVLMPRRGAVLTAKAGVAALVGAVLCLGTTVVAFGTARLGFAVAGTKIDVPIQLMVPSVREAVIAGLCGVLAVLACVVLRVRLLVVLVSAGACAVVAALLPGSTSPLIPFVDKAIRLLATSVPGVPFRSVLVGAAVLWWAAALVAVRRRRVS